MQVAQGQVEKSGRGRHGGRVTADKRAAWTDGAEQVWAGMARLQVQSCSTGARPYGSVGHV